MFTVQPLNINMGRLTPWWIGCNGWCPFRMKRGSGWLYGLEWDTVGWGAAALWLIRRLLLQWSSKSLSAYSAMFCSLLCPVIAVMLLFGTPLFCNLCTSVVHCGLWISCHCCQGQPFCNEFLDFTLTNCLLSVPQCCLGFFQRSQIQRTTCAEFCWTLTH